MKSAGRVLKLYSRVIAECIPLFVAAGVLSVFTAEGFQSTYLNEMSKILSYLVIPVFMGYKSGSMCGGDAGGLAGALAASAVVITENSSAILLSVVAGAIAGIICRRGMDWFGKKIPAGFEMLFSNLYLTLSGVITGTMVFLLFIPVADLIIGICSRGLSGMMETGILPLIGFMVEPLKIIFFNNWLNHGFFMPIGLEQIREGGSSILFLLETNPGPGFGILLAYALVYRDMRKNMFSGLIIHFLGGIHEIYFPYVLSNLWLLAAAIAGGIAGNYCFMLSGSGLLGPVSPGSVITILIMADHQHRLGIITGIVVSAAVTCLLACPILKKTEKKNKMKQPEEVSALAEKSSSEHRMDAVEISAHMRSEKGQLRLYFVCDVGLGSSAMASALFKRRIKMEGITGVEVFHVSADRIPAEADAVVCQTDFARSLPPLNVRCFTVENLTNMSCYEQLISWLKGGGEDGAF